MVKADVLHSTSFICFTVSMCFRYDVELFLRIEQLLGHKIPVYEPNKDSVMVMMERVTEAQRIAKLVRTKIFCLLHFASNSVQGVVLSLL